MANAMSYMYPTPPKAASPGSLSSLQKLKETLMAGSLMQYTCWDRDVIDKTSLISYGKSIMGFESTIFTFKETYERLLFF